MGGLSGRGRGAAARRARRVRRVREHQLQPGRSAGDRALRRVDPAAGSRCGLRRGDRVSDVGQSGRPGHAREPGSGCADDPDVRALRRAARRPGRVADGSVLARDPRRPHLRARRVRQQGADHDQPERGARLPRALRVGALQPRLRDRGRRGAHRRAAAASSPATTRTCSPRTSCTSPTRGCTSPACPPSRSACAAWPRSTSPSRPRAGTCTRASTAAPSRTR